VRATFQFLIKTLSFLTASQNSSYLLLYPQLYPGRWIKQPVKNIVDPLEHAAAEHGPRQRHARCRRAGSGCARHERLSIHAAAQSLLLRGPLAE
jgi:hypothetical protein